MLVCCYFAADVKIAAYTETRWAMLPPGQVRLQRLRYQGGLTEHCIACRCNLLLSVADDKLFTSRRHRKREVRAPHRVGKCFAPTVSTLHEVTAPGCTRLQCAWWLCENLVDPASSHMLVSKIKPCMSQYKLLLYCRCSWWFLRIQHHEDL